MTAAVLKDIPVNFAKLDSQTEKEDMGPSFCLDVPSALLPFFLELRNVHSSVHHTRRLTLAVPYLLLVNPNSTKTERGHTRVLPGERQPWDRPSGRWVRPTPHHVGSLTYQAVLSDTRPCPAGKKRACKLTEGTYTS
jgi:hypothetical protein